MSTSSPFTGGHSPRIPTDFALFLQSPEGVDATRKAYSPLPTAPTDAAPAHNKTFIQEWCNLYTN